MTLDEIIRKKKQYGYTNEQMAALSGLPLSTVQKVLGGTTKAPRHQTLAALSAVFPKDPGPLYFREDEIARARGIAETPAVYGAFAEERPSARWPRQGEYTLADYLALPDNVRVELIDGVFFEMYAPTTVHQLIAGAVYAEFLNFVNGKGGSCLPFIAPVDVQLDCDDRTVVEPDVMILCDRSKLKVARIFGAPEFILEIFSPSTRSKDRFIKGNKYAHAGVREYWMVDLKHEIVIKELFTPAEEEEACGTPDILTQIFPFDDPVPVTVFGEECKVRFRDFMDRYGIAGIPR